MRIIYAMLLVGLAINSGPTTTAHAARVRMKRGVFWDFFQKVVITKNLAVDQYADTRNTLNEVFNMLNEGFSDPVPSKPTLSTSTTQKPKTSSDDESEEITTTTEPYRVSRYEFGRILGRNFRGLRRLAKIEFADALNATQYNLQEYKAEADKQFANSLALEKKKLLKGIKS